MFFNYVCVEYSLKKMWFQFKWVSLAQVTFGKVWLGDLGQVRFG